jgi:predicted O-methyltransferase YrrM
MTTTSTKYFTKDWFSINIPTWEIILAELVNKPDINGLEIGVFQGRSTCWLLENIFTHPSATLNAVDTFQGNVEHVGMPEIDNLFTVFVNNTAEYGNKLTTFKMPSQVYLTSFKNTYDFIYVDGDHHAWACLEDMVLSWPQLKKNGIMIVDDYGGGEEDAEIQDLPKTGINSFLISYTSRYEILHVGYQLVIRKLF